MVVAERYLGLTMPHEQQADDPEPLGGAAAQQQSNTTTTTPAAAAAIATQLDPPVPAKLLRLADHVRKHVDLDQLLEVAAAAATVACTTSGSAALAGVPSQQQQLAQQHEQRPPQPCVHRPLAVPVRCRIAVARDEAFCFYYHVSLCDSVCYITNCLSLYPSIQLLTSAHTLWELLLPPVCAWNHIRLPPLCCRMCRCRYDLQHPQPQQQDNLALLRAAGAELVFFSPLRSTHLPDNIAGIYLGGACLCVCVCAACVHYIRVQAPYTCAHRCASRRTMCRELAAAAAHGCGQFGRLRCTCHVSDTLATAWAACVCLRLLPHVASCLLRESRSHRWLS